MIVVTGTPTKEAVQVVRRRGLSDLFDEVCGSPTRKPEILRGLLSRHGFAPQRTLMIGDAMTDYSAARATGVPFLGVGGSDHPFPPGTRVIPDWNYT